MTVPVGPGIRRGWPRSSTTGYPTSTLADRASCPGRGKHPHSGRRCRDPNSLSIVLQILPKVWNEFRNLKWRNLDLRIAVPRRTPVPPFEWSDRESPWSSHPVNQHKSESGIEDKIWINIERTHHGGSICLRRRD
jgi:hypothetical protein